MQETRETQEDTKSSKKVFTVALTSEAREELRKNREETGIPVGIYIKQLIAADWRARGKSEELVRAILK